MSFIMLNDKQKIIHKEFRTYLRVKEGIKGNMLNTLINAAEINLPALIREYFKLNFDCIYDDKYTIEELLSYAVKIKSDEEILAAPYGYISSKVLDSYIRFYAQNNGIDLQTIIFPNIENVEEKTEEVEEQLVEGRLAESKIIRRQRNRAARDLCLVASGYRCYICGFNFEEIYGEIGKDFIEIHHKKPISTFDEEHPISASDLCALCSNCHSMIHRKRETLDVDYLKNIFKIINGEKT